MSAASWNPFAQRRDAVAPHLADSFMNFAAQGFRLDAPVFRNRASSQQIGHIAAALVA